MKHSSIRSAIAGSALLCMAGGVGTAAKAESLVDFSAKGDSVEMYLVTEQGPETYIGTIEVQVTEYGIVFDPALSGLDPGLHGFHVHEDPSCEPNEKDADHQVVPAGKAGDHFDPTGVNTHGGPWSVGHVGDLPMLFVDENGNAEYPILAPKLKMEYLKSRSLMIHKNPDNYTDSPPNGGSGPRIACGVFFTEAMKQAE